MASDATLVGWPNPAGGCWPRAASPAAVASTGASRSRVATWASSAPVGSWWGNDWSTSTGMASTALVGSSRRAGRPGRCPGGGAPPAPRGRPDAPPITQRKPASAGSKARTDPSASAGRSTVWAARPVTTSSRPGLRWKRRATGRATPSRTRVLSSAGRGLAVEQQPTGQRGLARARRRDQHQASAGSAPGRPPPTVDHRRVQAHPAAQRRQLEGPLVHPAVEQVEHRLGIVHRLEVVALLLDPEAVGPRGRTAVVHVGQGGDPVVGRRDQVAHGGRPPRGRPRPGRARSRATATGSGLSHDPLGRQLDQAGLDLGRRGARSARRAGPPRRRSRARCGRRRTARRPPRRCCSGSAPVRVRPGRRPARRPPR